MAVLAVIPSRFGSTRFPGKALCPVAGVPMIVRVARQVLDAHIADEVIVATDDARIERAVEDLPVTVHVSQEPFACGSDRVAAAVSGHAADAVINVQGDEVLVGEAVLRAVLSELDRNDMGTAAVPLDDEIAGSSEDVVKVWLDEQGRAKAFGRRALFPDGLRHVGLYSFRRDALLRFASLKPTMSEARESLEQLRALEAGMRIGVAVGGWPSASVNRPSDLVRAERLIALLTARGSASERPLASDMTQAAQPARLADLYGRHEWPSNRPRSSS